MHHIKLTHLALASLLALTSGCYLYDETPSFQEKDEFMFPDGEPPCDPIEGLSRAVYVCIEEDYFFGALFVDTEGGSDENDGRWGNPTATLRHALTLASEDSNIAAILIAGSPSLPAPVRLTQDLSLLGGYDASFTLDPAARPKILAQSDSELALVATGLDNPVVIRRFEITGWEGASGASAAVLFDQVEVVIEDSVIRAGRGAHGIDGTAGARGEDGEKGKSAGSPSTTSPGEPGVNESCPMAQGGQGGDGGNAVASATPGKAAALTTLGGSVGSAGKDGAPGDPGQRGADATQGIWSMSGWQPGTSARDGDAGQPGQGGGGGGGGASMGGQGGGGGGGGAGGCAGQGGRAGSSGYPSVGIVAIDSAIKLSNTQIISQDGGNAGLGGDGGKGGDGDRGGLGASGLGGGQNGGRGGEGASGGDGGQGGDGVAGESWAVWCKASSLLHEGESSLAFGQGGVLRDGSRAPSGEVFGCD